MDGASREFRGPVPCRAVRKPDDDLLSIVIYAMELAKLLTGILQADPRFLKPLQQIAWLGAGCE